MALPSSTVENYLKAIYQAQSAQGPEHRLVPMGRLAGALGVVPGTATTMVKTLAESGLVDYEPYAGVRLTPAGEKLAALVLRRHRLIELFLVKVLGMSWADVHDEPVVLTRVTDQDSAVLRFLESSGLKPGQAIRVESRDAAADHVVVRGKRERQIMIGMRAAAKLQVAPVEQTA